MRLKIFSLCCFLLFLFNCKAQLIQGTIRSGSNNSIEVWIKPDFNNTSQYLFQLGFPIAFPATANPMPTALNCTLAPEFIAAFGNNYSMTINPVAGNTSNTEKYFTVVLIRTGAGASNPQTWNSGSEYKVLTATFNPSSSPAAAVKLADYQDGGSDKQGNFYTMDGNGNYYVTANSANNFYASTGLSNTGGNATEGFVQTVGNVPCSPPVLQPISGSSTIQLGQTIQLTNSTAGGVWSSDDVSIATVDASGMVTGVAPGVTTIHYKVTNACGFADVTLTMTIEEKRIVATIKPGSATNEVEIWLKPYFTNNSQYLFQIGLPIIYPAGVNPPPAIPGVADITIYDSLKTVFGDTYSISVNPLAQNPTGTEKYFNIVLIRNKTGASAPQSWTAGKEFKLLTVKFTNPGGLTQVKLGDYQDNGSDGQGNFYTMDGNGNYYVTSNSVSNFYPTPGQSAVGGNSSTGYVQTIPAVMPVCTDPNTPTITGITTTGAVIDWNIVTGAASGYEYVISTNSSLPASGIPVAINSYTATGLQPGTKYFVYIRSVCAPGIFSGWASANFSTDCPAATTPVVSNITQTGASISWPGVTGAIGYQYVITTSSSIPSAGTTTSTPGFTASSLTPGTLYNVFVRTLCSSGSFSTWSMATFTTTFPDCLQTTILPITNVTSSATIKWLAFTGIAGYEYVVSTVSTPPLTGGTFITDNSYVASGLNSGTTYYAHVRVQCGTGRFSPWATKQFSTPCFEPTPFVSAITSKTGTADIGWHKVANVARYEYAILGDELSPGGSSGFTNDTILHETGLRPGGKYYLHVRTHCTLGSISPWSVLEFHTTGIEVYPNPANAQITITMYGLNTNDNEIAIFDAIGREMKRLKLNGNTAIINIGNFMPGVYFIRYNKDKANVSAFIKK